MNKRKEASIMTNVLAITEDFIMENKNSKEKVMKRYEEKINLIKTYMCIRNYINSEAGKSVIAKNIVKDKNIKNGKWIIKGTRLTPEDITRILYVKKNVQVDDFFSEYPSLETKEQIIAGLLMYVKKQIHLGQILFDR